MGWCYMTSVAYACHSKLTDFTQTKLEKKLLNKGTSLNKLVVGDGVNFKITQDSGH